METAISNSQNTLGGRWKSCKTPLLGKTLSPVLKIIVRKCSWRKPVGAQPLCIVTQRSLVHGNWPELEVVVKGAFHNSSRLAENHNVGCKMAAQVSASEICYSLWPSIQTSRLWLSSVNRCCSKGDDFSLGVVGVGVGGLCPSFSWQPCCEAVCAFRPGQILKGGIESWGTSACLKETQSTCGPNQTQGMLGINAVMMTLWLERGREEWRGTGSSSSK